MAITKILNIGACSEGLRSRHLKNTLMYIVNEEKTNEKVWVGSVNCLPLADAAYEQMIQTKQYFGKELGRQGYHIIISFEKEECRPETAFQIGGEFVETFLQDCYECVYAVHDDKEHCHLHIIYNSINMLDGKKYHYNKGDWKYVVQPITNALCEKYGLAIMPAEYSREKTNVPRDEWQHDRVFSHFILDNARYCLSIAEDEDHFIWLMERLGYSVKTGVHLAVKAPGMKRYKRLDTLDKAFARDVIEESIAKAHDDDIRMEEFTFDPEPYFKIGMCGLQKKYYGYMVRMRKVEMNRFYYHSAKYYKDIMEMHRLHGQYMFLVKNNVHYAEDLLAVKNWLEKEMDEISEEQQSIYKANADAKKRCREAKDLLEFQRVHFANERRLLELKGKKKKLRSELKTAGELTEEMELSIEEVFLEEGWMYGDYSKVPDQPEAPKYPEEREEWRNEENGYEERSSDERVREERIREGEDSAVGDFVEMNPVEDLNLEYYDGNAGTTDDWLEEDTEISEASDANPLETMFSTSQEYDYIWKETRDSNPEPVGAEIVAPDIEVRDFQSFLRLSYEEKADLLCKTPEDVENIIYVLNDYASSLGYRYSDFDDLMQEADRIAETALNRKNQDAVDKIIGEMKNAGITASNFNWVNPKWLAVQFLDMADDLSRMTKVFTEVVKRMGVKMERMELQDLFMEVCREAERGKTVSKDDRYRGRTAR